MMCTTRHIRTGRKNSGIMRIFCSDENFTESAAADVFHDAAVLCMEKEGLNHENAEISLSFVSKDEIHRLNRMYRDVDRHTDVLSFPMIEDFNEIDDDEELLLGDVVICTEQAEQQAEEYGHSKEREMTYLFVHSVLHLLGYDHMEEDDKIEMRAREEEVMSQLGIAR